MRWTTAGEYLAATLTALPPLARDLAARPVLLLLGLSRGSPEGERLDELRGPELSARTGATDLWVGTGVPGGVARAARSPLSVVPAVGPVPVVATADTVPPATRSAPIVFFRCRISV